MQDLSFEQNGFRYIIKKYNKKNNTIVVEKYELSNNKSMGTQTLKTGTLPKKIKQKLNPLK